MLVLLTGVGRPGQVGEVVASRFAADGATVLLVDRTEENVRARAQALTTQGRSAVGYACDLSDEHAVERLANQVRDEHGAALDALVLMAGGFGMSGPIETSMVDDWEHQLTINLRTAYLSVRSFLPMVRAARGGIVFFASAAALPGAKVAGTAAYAAAKAGVVTLMQSVAQQERDTGVRANALAPVAIRTTANLDTMGQQVRYVEREDVAGIVRFLCSDAARSISGQVIRLD